MGIRQYAGPAAAAKSLASDITSGTTAVVVNNADNWPTGDFYYAIDRANASIEVLFCTTRIGTTLTSTRGQDGSTAVTHAAGATVELVFTATDAREANAVAGLIDAKGDLIAGTSFTAWGRLNVGANGLVVTADSTTSTGLKYATGPIFGTNEVATSQATTSTTYADLATVGPTVALTTGATVKVILTSRIVPGAATEGFMGVAVSGATTRAASDADSLSTTAKGTLTSVVILEGLTPGANTFVAKYRADTGTSTAFQYRTMTVERLN